MYIFEAGLWFQVNVEVAAEHVPHNDLQIGAGGFKVCYLLFFDATVRGAKQLGVQLLIGQ